MPAPQPTETSRALHGATAHSSSFHEAMRLWNPTRANEDSHVDQKTQKLDVLHPMPLLPNRLVKRRAYAVMALKRIECLTVNKNHSGFCVDVYCRDTHSRIPVHGQYAQAVRLEYSSTRESTEPSVTLQVGFDDFMQLRLDAYEFARVSHMDGSPCSFCRDVILLNATSGLRPRWSARLFKSDREICDQLEKYLFELLRISAGVPSSGIDLCRGQERVPRLLQHFLRSHESERQSF